MRTMYARLFAIVAMALFSATAHGGPKPKVGDLWFCLDVDGGIRADSAPDGTPIFYGLTATTRSTFEFVVHPKNGATSTFLVQTGACTRVGEFRASRGAPLVITQIGPRFDAGTGVSTIEAQSPTKLISFDVEARTAKIALRPGRNDLLFAVKTLCTTTSFNSGPPEVLGAYCQDAADGIAEINVLEADNCTVAISAFAAGTKDFVEFTVTKTQSATPASWRIETISVDGTRAETHFNF